LTVLERQPWPGNVREIVNLCERAVLLAGAGDEISPDDIPESIASDRVVRVRRDGGAVRLEIPDGISFDEIERAAIAYALEKAGGNVSAAAASLSMGRGQFRYRMEKLGLVAPDQEDPARARRGRPTRGRPAARRGP
jgi:DNA-binding NtrC family response regulator